MDRQKLGAGCVCVFLRNGGVAVKGPGWHTCSLEIVCLIPAATTVPFRKALNPKLL